MNVPTHLSGQVPTQVGQQVPGSAQLTVNSLSSQMQGIGNHTHKIDSDLLIKRRSTQDYIIQLLQRKSFNPNSVFIQKIPEMARRLEERIYRDALLQGEDYCNLSSTAINQRLQGIIKLFISNQDANSMPSSSSSSVTQ